MQLLVIEDDSDSAGWLADRLSGSGFVASKASSAEIAVTNGLAERADAVIVDVGPGNAEGSQFVRPFREAGFDQPLLLLAAGGNWRDRVDSLDAGADDYLIKPVRAEEVAARLRAIIRRSAGSAGDRIAAGRLELDIKARMAWLDGAPLDLTRNEFRLLAQFMLRPGKVLDQTQLLERLYPASAARSRNAIEVHIARLRRKIGANAIHTVRGVGYRFVAPSAAADG